VVTEVFRPFQRGRWWNRGPQVMWEKQRIWVIHQWRTRTHELCGARRHHCHVRGHRRFYNRSLPCHETRVNLVFSHAAATIIFFGQHRRCLIFLVSHNNHTFSITFLVSHHRRKATSGLLLQLLLRRRWVVIVLLLVLWIRTREAGEFLHQWHEILRLSVDNFWRMCVNDDRVTLLLRSVRWCWHCSVNQGGWYWWWRWRWGLWWRFFYEMRFLADFQRWW